MIEVNKESEFTGHLVKKIRKSFGLKQFEIVDQSITRNLISLVENNKAPLTQNTARIVVQCINKHADKNNLPLRITELDLSIEGMYEAKVEVLKLLSQIQHPTEISIEQGNSLIQSLNLILSQYDLDELKAEAYEKIGDYYYQNGDYKHSNAYYSRAHESIRKITPQHARLSIINNLMRTYILLNDYQEVIRYAEIGESYCPKKDSRLFRGILFNKALGYQHLKEPTKAILVLEELKLLWTDFSKSQLFDLNLLICNCLKKSGEHEVSLEKYNVLLNEDLSPIQYALVYSNMLEVFENLNDKENTLKTLQNMSEFSPYFAENPYYACQILMDMTHSYIYIEDHKSALSTLLRTLALSKIANNHEMVMKSIVLLTDPVFRNLISTEEIYVSFIELIDLKMVKKQDPQLFRIIRYFNEVNKSFYVNKILIQLEDYFGEVT